MLRSMTGFGRAEQTVGDKTFLVEVKALNGKQFELQLKLPALLKPFEFDIRNILQENLIRGTVDCYISIKQNGTAKPVIINTDLIKAYYHQIETLAADLKIDTNEDVLTISSEAKNETSEERDGYKKIYINLKLYYIRPHHFYRYHNGQQISKIQGCLLHIFLQTMFR